MGRVPPRTGPRHDNLLEEKPMLDTRWLLVLSALTFTACPAPPKDGETPVSTATVSASPHESASVPVTTTTFTPGKYTSPHCGDRKYAREVTFDATSFTAADLVSPCPPNVDCVWSGIVNRKGTYAVDGSRLNLKIETETAGPGGMPFPAFFMLSERAIVETSEHGSCVYSLE